MATVVTVIPVVENADFVSIKLKSFNIASTPTRCPIIARSPLARNIAIVIMVVSRIEESKIIDELLTGGISIFIPISIAN